MILVVCLCSGVEAALGDVGKVSKRSVFKYTSFFAIHMVGSAHTQTTSWRLSGGSECC